MLGVWVNFACVVVGGLLGTLLRGGIPKKYQTALNQVLALCVLVIGVSGAIETSNALIVIVSAVVGTFLGELLRIERGLDRLGKWRRRALPAARADLPRALSTPRCSFPSAPWPWVGSLEAGLRNNPDTLLAKVGHRRRLGGHLRLHVRHRRGLFRHPADHLSGRHRRAFRRARALPHRRAHQ